MTEQSTHAVVDAPTVELLRCGRCPIRVRRAEMDVHLAHAHDIGPTPAKKEKGKGRDRARGGS